MYFHAPFEVHIFDAYHAVLPKNGSLKARNSGLSVASHCKNVESKRSSYCHVGVPMVGSRWYSLAHCVKMQRPMPCHILVQKNNMLEEVRRQNHRANFSTPLAPCLRGDLMTRKVLDLMNTSPHASPRDMYGPLHRKLWAARRMEASS